jgi:ATP-dependent helicase/nuclease subunit B
MALWIIERERERRVSVEEVFAELKGRWEFTLDGSAFTLTTRIDRLERGREGQLTVIDYKTGTSPGKTDIDTGRANQLPLEALIAEYGVIEPAIGAFTSCAGLEYWKLSGNPDTCKIIATGVASVPGAMERLEALITHYNDPRTPYAAQIGVPARYNDYAHLTRRSEWEEV